MILIRPDGPVPAKIMIVGEAPGVEEESKGVPFVGVSGMELNKMLAEAGILRSECFVTNVCRQRPPKNDISLYFAQSKKSITSSHVGVRSKHVLPPIAEGILLLSKEIQAVQPNIILALGNTALWALTGRWGITKWRGSMLSGDGLCCGVSQKILPTLHPAAVLRQWNLRAATVADLRRAARFKDGAPYPVPKWDFILRPSYAQAVSTLNFLLSRVRSGARLRLSFDLETRGGHIACAGIAWSRTNAICIPFMQVAGDHSYWSVHEEATLVFLIYQLLLHPMARVVGQNLLYDCQYTYRHWHFAPNVVQDTMVSQHSIFSDLPKSLAFLASMYCDYYVYWKDEGKNWEPGIGEAQLWHYNCLDCVYTYEVSEVLESVAEKMNLKPVYDFQQSLFWPVLEAMKRGVLIDQKRRNQLIDEVQEAITAREQFLINVLGHPINPRSPLQMQKLFYSDLRQPVQMTRAKKGVPGHATLNDEALQKISQKEPLLKPIINAICDIRTLGIFVSTFLTAALGADGRMRCSYNIGGSISGKSAPKTYRLSSSEDAFGSGANLQTIPSEKSKSLGKAAARGGIQGIGDPYQFPNIRSIFVPDHGHVWFDGDLDRADLQVVVSEADDKELKAMMREGVDMHVENAKALGCDRQMAKVWVHGTNYGGGPRTMAINCGLTVHRAEQMQSRWFAAHPGIKSWHDRVKAQIFKHRFVQNRFGYRWYIFDRLDAVLPEAIAWIPQSTVSIVINKIWKNIYDRVTEVQVLMQVHDSLCGQIPQDLVSSAVEKIEREARVVIPYEDPLTIPFSLKLSKSSWGEVVSKEEFFNGSKLS